MEMSCRTSSYFSSIDNGVSSERCFIFTRARPSLWRTARAAREVAAAPAGRCERSLCPVSDGIYLLLERQLTHTEIVYSLIAAGDALFQEALQLALDVGPFPCQLKPPQLRNAIGGDQDRRNGLRRDLRDQPCFLCT